MKTTLGALYLLAIFNIAILPVSAGIRCHNDIISPGDSTAQVRMKLSMCGEMLDKEIVKKETVVDETENDKVKKVKKETVTEIWYIRVKERGGMYCYPLSFEAGRLQSIGRWTRCK